MENLNKINAHLGTVRGIAENVDETRTIEFVISSEQRDRYNTVLKVDKWRLENYRKNPVVGYNHPFMAWSSAVQYDPKYIIGTGEVTQDFNNKLVIGKVKFLPADINPLSETVFQFIKHGALRSTSVGFFETEEGNFGEGEESRGAKNETYYYGEQELFEFSVVDVPANTDATVRFFKDLKEKCPTHVANELEKLRNYAKTSGKAQAEACLEFLKMEKELLMLK